MNTSDRDKGAADAALAPPDTPEARARTEALTARVSACKAAALARGLPDDHNALLSDESYFLAIFELNAWRTWGIEL